VFPELDGIARSLWETEALWNPDRRRPHSGLQPTAPPEENEAAAAEAEALGL